MFLGIDLGTSGIKLLLLDEQHRIVATEGRSLKVHSPRPLWNEQDPEDWLDALDGAMRALADAQPRAMALVQAIGLSGQMHGAVLLDAHDEVIRPAILWNDGRSADACRTLERTVPRLHEITGNLAMPGFTAPKLVWVREHEPEHFARVAKVLLPKDWLRFRMCGEYLSDCSDAAGTLWLDVARRDWSDEVLAACGLARRLMPGLVEGSAPAGRLDAAMASRWGLRAGTLIAGGGGDNAASAVGIGAVHPNQGFVSLGTSGVIFLCNDRFRPNPRQAVHAFCHAIPDTWHQMAVMLSAASALSWGREMLGVSSEAQLIESVAALPDSERRRAPIFLPYLNGERSPHNDPHAQGVLFGLIPEHRAAHVGHALLEGVAFGLREGWDSLGANLSDIDALSLVGGGSRSAHWAKLLASVIGIPLQTHEGSEAGGALGAARLGWLAAGGTPDEVCMMPPVQARFEPVAGIAEEMAPRLERYRRLYRVLKDEFRPLNPPDWRCAAERIFPAGS